jgi:hypothetical protein
MGDSGIIKLLRFKEGLWAASLGFVSIERHFNRKWNRHTKPFVLQGAPKYRSAALIA